ncbi:Sulfite reductase [ferredoxin] [Pirellulimonas nuda]|uniref:Sulfite reductase [ferredoxin] n=1 Tax=Pirellulimonas nuda TaxID=2528009 RepID=A0A518DG54_9BACT|nr:NirA family protein [Pirellulimonas nuda]QDU90455.1 Sulfite reductase [ferredoxin] [Pirellulimonas nuda]
MPSGFSSEQQSYIQGLAIGADVARSVRGLPVFASSGTTVSIGGAPATPRGGPHRPDQLHYDAQDRQSAAGGKLVAEERAKREKNPLDQWDEIEARAARGEFPKGIDVFLTKYHGLFYVTPAQDAFMCRLRFPGGAVRSYQLAGLADLALAHAGGYADVTTRSNLQLREIPAAAPAKVMVGLRNLGIVNTGAGADNIRNVTASPLSGLDPHELIETLPLAQELNQYILNRRELFGLPRKFNVAFDGGGRVSALEDTNDIGLHAVRLEEPSGDSAAGVYFQLALGGITGHEDFARPTGVLLLPEECINVCGAILRVFIANGDRTDRKRARLKYLLDDWGFERFLTEVEKELGKPLRRAPVAAYSRPAADDRLAHIGFHPQRQPGLCYLGVVLPVGRLTSQQMRGLARISDRFGNGDLRLTVWQNLLIPNIRVEDQQAVAEAVEALGLGVEASSVRAGLVACTGSAGCKYAGADTKRNAMEIAQYVDDRLELDTPVNIHVTGCHHSCAQHYIGDIGLIATSVDVGDDTVEGYHLFVGGGYGDRQRIGRELFSSVRADEVPALVTRILEGFLDARESVQQSFAQFTAARSVEELKRLFTGSPAPV